MVAAMTTALTKCPNRGGQEGEVIDIVTRMLECGALERCCGPYRNPWILVPKKGGGHRLINPAQRLNAVTIKDASLPPSADEEFAGYPILSLLDLFSGYDQCALAPESRDVTAFMTPFGLLRMTALPQAVTEISIWALEMILKSMA